MMLNVEDELKEIIRLQKEAMVSCCCRVRFHGWSFSRMELDVIYCYLRLIVKGEPSEVVGLFDGHGYPLRKCDLDE